LLLFLIMSKTVNTNATRVFINPRVEATNLKGEVTNLKGEVNELHIICISESDIYTSKIVTPRKMLDEDVEYKEE